MVLIYDLVSVRFPGSYGPDDSVSRLDKYRVDSVRSGWLYTSPGHGIIRLNLADRYNSPKLGTIIRARYSSPSGIVRPVSTIHGIRRQRSRRERRTIYALTNGLKLELQQELWRSRPTTSDPNGVLLKLLQLGMVDDYQREFEKLVNKACFDDQEALVVGTSVGLEANKVVNDGDDSESPGPVTPTCDPESSDEVKALNWVQKAIDVESTSDNISGCATVGTVLVIGAIAVGCVAADVFVLHVIKLVLALIQQPIPVDSLHKGFTFEDSSWNSFQKDQGRPWISKALCDLYKAGPSKKHLAAIIISSPVHTPQVDIPTPPTPPTPPPPPTPQSVPRIMPEHEPTPTNDSPTVSSHPMVTRSRVGTTRPNPRYAGHVSTISPLPRSYKEAFNDPN
nr:ribonuclease H-like domain-containing protein [Tanacetum cinerariifolium]GEV33911.1 ribonuclease H-like domain-containing protein [Tanacetum cinerariifolium]